MILNKLAKNLENQNNLNYKVNIHILRSYVHIFLTLIGVFAIAFILDIFKIVSMTIIATMALRGFSGGSHSESKITCSLISITIPISIALFSKYQTLFSSNNSLLLSTTVFLFGILIIHKYAPADTPQKPIISERFRKQLRNRSYIFLIICQLVVVFLYLTNSIWFTEVTLSLTLGICWQLFTLTPSGYRFMHRLDSAFNKSGE